MPFHFVRISLPGAPLYQVRLDSPSGRLLGTVAEESGAYVASVVVAGKLHNRPFTDREKAAA